MRSKIFPVKPVKSRDWGNVERVDNVDKWIPGSYGNREALGKTGKNRIFPKIGQDTLCKLKNPHPIWKVFPIWMWIMWITIPPADVPLLAQYLRPP